jgi:hypothetical protein
MRECLRGFLGLSEKGGIWGGLDSPQIYSPYTHF